MERPQSAESSEEARSTGRAASGAGLPAAVGGLGGRLALSLGAFVLTFALLEGALWLAAAFVEQSHDRSAGATVPASDARFRILCVGDSNTYGLYVKWYEAYPAHLERSLAALDTRLPIEVVNQGVPGMNSAQLLHRLPGYLERYRPDLVIALVGVTDHWNLSEMDAVPVAGEGSSGAQQWLWRSRVFRVVALAIENLGDREPLPEASRTSGEPVPSPVKGRRLGDDAEWQAPVGSTPSIGDAKHREVLARNLERIVAYMDSTGVPLVLPTYVADIWHYQVANAVIRDVGGAIAISSTFEHVLSSRDPELASRPREEIFFLPIQHPRSRNYHLYAEHLRDELTLRGLIASADTGLPGASE